MYLSHFDLKIKPFRISPDPKFLWLGETHKEALAMMKYGIQDNRGFLLLSGDIGTGKTTLINGLLDSLDDQTLVAMISDPGLEKLDFYNFLTQAFNIRKTFKSKGDFLVHFIHFLHRAYAEGKKVLIIIDEAQRLSYEMLEEIRQLSNIEKKDTKLLNIFLVGQHELIDALNETRNRALLQRITMKYLIEPLNPADVGAYIAFRLKIAGTEKKIFSGEAVRQVISFSNGYPRLINIICDHALLTTYVKGKQKVDGAIVKECAKDLQIKVQKPRGSLTNIRLVDRIFDAIRHPLQNKMPGFLIYLGLLLLILSTAGMILFSSNILPPWITEKLSLSAIAPIITQTDKKVASSDPVVAQPQQSREAFQLDDVQSKNEDERIMQTKLSPSEPAKQNPPPIPFEDKLYTIQFPLDSNEFSPEAFALLNDIVVTSNRHQGLEILVTGHTDTVGDAAYNRRLSKYRATVVKSFLVGQGIASDQIIATGVGPDKPIATNETREGRRQNRRVEILLRRSEP